MNILDTQMQLQPSRKEHALEIMNWFPEEDDCRQWGGPIMRFPFREKTFLEDIHWKKIPSYSAITHEGLLLGFGQFYEKLGRCHLARLAVSPQYRSLGLGRTFICSLMHVGQEQLDTNRFSLYVLSNNAPAVACYQSLGFELAETPEEAIKLKYCVYMIAAFD
ncbi:GNAT family N-acetyltransferase [Pseudomonadota bacterium]